MKPLDCVDIKAMLSGLLDDEIDGQSRHEAERHMAVCGPCRTLVSQAERLNDMILLDAQALAGGAELPEDFESRVLSRTVYADAYHHAGHRWTSWLGWVAAAACLGLASAVWFLERQMPRFGNQLAAEAPHDPHPGKLPSVAVVPNERSAYTVSAKSWVHDGGLPALPASLRSSAEDDESDRPGFMNQATMDAIDAKLELARPAVRPDALADLSERPSISPEDARTFHTAASLLDLLAQADTGSFADVDHVRQIAEYDELLPRLEQARNRLPAADRPIVLAAESVLLRVVQGPMSMDDLRLMHDTVASLDLSVHLGALSDRRPASSSL